MTTVQVAQYFSEEDFKLLTFFTVWNYRVQIVYFLLAALGLILPSNRRQNFIMNHLFSIVLPLCILVSIVLWGILAPQAAFSKDQYAIDKCINIFSVFQHAVNTCCILLDFKLSRFYLDDGYITPFLLGWDCIWGHMGPAYIHKLFPVFLPRIRHQVLATAVRLPFIIAFDRIQDSQ